MNLKVLSSLKFWQIIAFVILSLSIAGLDQSTKRHAEKNYLVWYHPTEVNNYHSKSTQWFILGHKQTIPSPSISSSPNPSPQWFEINLTYVRNTGAIWGILQNLPKNFSNTLFLIVYPIFICFLIYNFYLSHAGQRLLRTSISLIIGGAIGNLIDRIFVNYVVDWIHPYWRIFSWEYSYPVFNVADIAIVSGVILWCIDSLIESYYLKKEIK